MGQRVKVHLPVLEDCSWWTWSPFCSDTSRWFYTFWRGRVRGKAQFRLASKIMQILIRALTSEAPSTRKISRGKNRDMGCLNKSFRTPSSWGSDQATECPKMYRKSVLHLLKYTSNLYCICLSIPQIYTVSA